MSTIENESASQKISDAKKNYHNRFEFVLSVNEFIVCKRAFDIEDFVEGSMQTNDFKLQVDMIVDRIQEDLKRKSRIYVNYHADYKHEGFNDPEMYEELSPEGDCIFTFTVFDNKKPVISRSWDGRYYPVYVRKNVDLTNRQVKITNKDNEPRIYDKDEFFADEERALFGELWILKQMIINQPDLVAFAIESMTSICTDRDLSNYERLVEYCNTDGSNSRYYSTNLSMDHNRLKTNWGSAVSEKTKQYMEELFFLAPKAKYVTKK